MRTSRAWFAATVVALALPAQGQAQDPLRVTEVLPAEPRAGQPVQVTVAGPADEAVRVCLVPAVGAERCALSGAQGPVTFAGTYPGRWTVTAHAGGRQASRQVLVRPRSGRLVVLAAGDSLVRDLAAGMAGRLAAREDAVLHVDLHNGSGLSPPCCLDWVEHARPLAQRLDPDVVVVFLGANEGYALDGVPCCGERWVERYAARQRAFVATLAQGGRARVYYATLPAPGPSQPARRAVWSAVNRALARVTAADEARVFDLGALMTPGFRYRRTMPWRGRRVVVRQADGIHLTPAGGRIAAGALLRLLRADGVDVPAAGGSGAQGPDGDGDGEPPEVGFGVRLRDARMTVRLRNPDSRWTLHELDVRPPPTVRLDPAGIPVCGEAAALELRCGARTGGAGRALVTAAGDPSRVTTYAVALVRLDARGALGLRFSTPSGRAHLTPATLRTISGRQRLRFRLPPAVVGTDGAYASLRSLRVRLGAERRGRAFVSVQGCRRRAHRFRARARFLENGLTPDARVDVRRAAACR